MRLNTCALAHRIDLGTLITEPSPARRAESSAPSCVPARRAGSSSARWAQLDEPGRAGSLVFQKDELGAPSTRWTRSEPTDAHLCQQDNRGNGNRQKASFPPRNQNSNRPNQNYTPRQNTAYQPRPNQSYATRPNSINAPRLNPNYAPQYGTPRANSQQSYQTPNHSYASRVSTPQAQMGEQPPLVCYRRGGQGHMARDCATPDNRQKSVGNQQPLQDRSQFPTLPTPIPQYQPVQGMAHAPPSGGVVSGHLSPTGRDGHVFLSPRT